MQTYGTLCAMSLAGTAAAEEELRLPSGATPRLFDVVTAEGYEAPVWHFRFLWPGLSRDLLAGEAMADDMEALCNAVAAPRIAAEGGTAERIVIAVSDREFAFGEAAPDAVQSFEAFVLTDAGTCEWEPF
ncbi:MAG TPA: acetolactate synthase [Aliiroseovarius sp.]|nr:acetolactate synthase [Aliiroseovarius sp.]